MLLPALFSWAGDFEGSENVTLVSSTHEGEGYTFQINVNDVGEPIAKPIRMSVALVCSQGQAQRKVQLMDQMPVCNYKSYEFERDKHKLTIKYLEHLYNDKDKSVTCKIAKIIIFYLKQECLEILKSRTPQNSKPNL